MMKNDPQDSYLTGRAKPYFNLDEQHFDYWPKVVRSDASTTIQFQPSTQLNADKIYFLYMSENGHLQNELRSLARKSSEIKPSFEDGVFSATVEFAGEMEHELRVVEKNDDGEFSEPIAILKFYSLKEDLFALSPYKGDFHIHSNQSDGIDEPIDVAVAARSIGLDFMALTDHHKYQPSVDVINAMEKIDAGLKCFPGEEVHAPGSYVHIVNFGSGYSVNDLFQSDRDVFDAEVKAREGEMDSVPPELRNQLASSEWVFDKIKDGGGIAMFCHPYWKPANRLYMNEDITRHIMRRQKFDVLEVIGGYHRFELESNALAIAMYDEYRAGGAEIPVAGVSDAHGCSLDLFGWYYTIVLAKSDSWSDIAEGIRKLNSVAIEAVPGQFPRVVGPMRLVKLVYFLMREVFPLHDELCKKEGELMRAYFNGDELAAAKLTECQGGVHELMRRYYNNE